jgi:hypothetical protein
MSRRQDKEAKQSRSLRMVGRLRDALTEPERFDPNVRAMSIRLLARTERVMERLDGVVGVLETVARLEVDILKRMVPIVDDLGELVRHSLDDARRRRSLARKATGHPVIDVSLDVHKKEKP